jgi:hypothetical protein
VGLCGCIFLHSPRQHTYEFDFETLRVVIVPQFELLVSSFQKVVPWSIQSKTIWFVSSLKVWFDHSHCFDSVAEHVSARKASFFWQLLKASTFHHSSLYENRRWTRKWRGRAACFAIVLFYCRPVSGPKNKNMRDETDDVMPCSWLVWERNESNRRHEIWNYRFQFTFWRYACNDSATS